MAFRLIGSVGFFLTAFTSVVAAQELELSLPLDCTLGETCFIQQFVDHDPSPDAMDFACGSATYDGHKGTDIRLPSATEVASGVDVLAAAPGVVLGLRDGMVDKVLRSAADRSAIKGRECGNGVVLDHGNGWRTQYCHMKRGSIQVKKGVRLARGAPLGQVGLSGNTEFPHLHITVNKDEQIIDPFQWPKVNKCGAYDENNLWVSGIPKDFTYQPTQVVLTGFAAQAVKYAAVQDGEYADLSPLSRSKPLVAFGLAVNLQAGDVFRVTLDGPEGNIVDSKSEPFTKNKAQWMSFSGKNAPSTGWPKGQYQSRISVLRAGKLISSRGSFYQMK